MRKLPKKWQLCIMLFLATVLNYLNRQTLSLLAPTLQKELMIGNEALGWLFAIFYYTYTFSHMVVGTILDRVNLRWAFAWAVVLWSVVSALTGLANGFTALLVCRLFLGVMESPNWPGGINVVSRLMEPRERALGNGLFTSGTSAAALIAPVLILGIAAYAGWRWTFVAIGSLGAFWAIGWLFMSRDKNIAHVWRPRPATSETAGWAGQWRILKKIVRSPTFWPVFVVVILVNPCLYYSVNWLPTYFVQQRGLSVGSEMGWILTAIYLGLDLGNLASGATILALTRRGVSTRTTRRIVFIFATLCVMCCAAVPILPLVGAVVALVFFNFGQGIWQTISLTMEQEVSSTHVSTALGIISGCGSLSGALAMWAVGRITQHTGSFTIPMVAVGVTAVFSAIFGWFASKNAGAAAPAMLNATEEATA